MIKLLLIEKSQGWRVDQAFEGDLDVKFEMSI